VPWADGDTVDIVWGAQGGMHVDLRLRMTGFRLPYAYINLLWLSTDRSWAGIDRTVECEASGCVTNCTSIRSLLSARVTLEEACAMEGRVLEVIARAGDDTRFVDTQIAFTAHVWGPSSNALCPAEPGP
jgi:hypothetical protein